MKKAVLFIVSILLLIIVSTTMYFNYHKSKISDFHNDELKLKIEEVIETKNSATLEFSKIATSFQWDRLYVIHPYSDFKSYGIENSDFVDNSIKTNDNINLLVFTLNNKVVSYVNYPRDKGDFSKTSNKDGYTFENANFSIEYEKDWTYIK